MSAVQLVLEGDAHIYTDVWAVAKTIGCLVSEVEGEWHEHRRKAHSGQNHQWRTDPPPPPLLWKGRYTSRHLGIQDTVEWAKHHSLLPDLKCVCHLWPQMSVCVFKWHLAHIKRGSSPAQFCKIDYIGPLLLQQNNQYLLTMVATYWAFDGYFFCQDWPGQ